MTVPRLLVLTDRHASAAAGRPLARTVGSAVDAGARAVVLREKDLAPPARHELARELLAVTDQAGARLLVASDAALAAAVGADGVHLATSDPHPSTHPPHWLVGRSCHTPAEVGAVSADELSYVTISPVAPTPSKPGYGPPIGRGGVAAAVAVAGEVPVFALGGVTAENAPDWYAAGAYGLAVMGGVMSAEDPGARVRALLAARPTESP